MKINRTQSGVAAAIVLLAAWGAEIVRGNANPTNILTGSAAFASYKTEKPGDWHRITARRFAQTIRDGIFSKRRQGRRQAGQTPGQKRLRVSKSICMHPSRTRPAKSGLRPTATFSLRRVMWEIS